MAKLVACCAVLTVAVIAAGCGGKPAAETEANQRAKFEVAAAKFQSCMKEHGVEINAQVGQDGGMMVRAHAEPGSASSPDSAKFQEANKACEKILADARPQGAERDQDDGQFQKNALAFAKCMRDNGVDMPDPQFESGGRVKMTMGKIDPKNPKFEAADKKCRAANPGAVPGGPMKAGPAVGGSGTGQ
jgi:hypothetical protein